MLHASEWLSPLATMNTQAANNNSKLIFLKSAGQMQSFTGVKYGETRGEVFLKGKGEDN